MAIAVFSYEIFGFFLFSYLYFFSFVFAKNLNEMIVVCLFHAIFQGQYINCFIGLCICMFGWICV